MAEVEEGVDQAILGVAARHALHDEELVAAFAADGLEDAGERERARAVVERCQLCRDLHADMITIGEALLASARFTASAPRDFRLTESDAIRLGGYVTPRGFVNRLARALGEFGRPLGASMATLGLIGMLVGSITIGGGPAAGSLAIDAAATAAPAGELVPGAEPQGTGSTTAVNPGSSAHRQGDGAAEQDFDPTRSSSAILTVLSAALLIGGVILLMIGARGRRSGRQ